MIQMSVYKQLSSAGATSYLNVSLRIDRGKSLGIAGPSGSGKTTLLKILAGLIKPDSGELTVDGETWFDSDRNINRPSQKRDIGFVFQDYALFPNMTVRKNLEFAFTGKKDIARVDSIMDMLDISSIADQRPGKLSGGQQQRVALGRALIRRPGLLLLDEPLSALDPEMRSKLQQDLRTVASNFEGILIVVSHDPADILHLADRVVLLKKGQTERSGTPAELFVQQSGEKYFPGSAEILDILPDKRIMVVRTIHGLLSIPFRDNEGDRFQIGDTVSLSIKEVEHVKC